MFSIFRRRPAPAVETSLHLGRWQELATLIAPHYQLERELSSRHELVHLLGTGRDGEKVVVTCVAPGYLDSGRRQRCLRDLEICLHLPLHPAIVPVLRTGSQGDWIWWVHPWIEAESLHRRLKLGPVDLAQAIRWIGDIAEALEFIHAQNITHRELSPRVLWLGKDRLRLSGLGIPRPDYQQTRAGSGPDLGDPNYLSPEAITGGTMGPSTDLYALGVIAYEMLTGKRPFESPDVIQTLFKTMTEAHRPITELRPELPNSLVSLVDRLLAKEAAQRVAPDVDLLNLIGTIRPNSPHSQEMSQFLSQLEVEGDRVSEDSTFTLDAAQALHKLKNFQFEEPGAFLSALAAAAQDLGCSRLEVSDGPAKVILKYHGVRLSRLQLENLWSYAFSTESPGLRHLALGLAGALGQPGSTFTVASDGLTFSAALLQAPGLKRSSNGDLTVTIKSKSLPFGLDRFAYSRLEMRRQGALISQTLQPNRPTFQVGSKHYAVYVDPLANAERLAVVDGMCFTLPPGRPLVGRMVIWGPLQIDLSYQRLVRNELYTQVLNASQHSLDEAMKEFALLPEVTDYPKTQYRYAVSLWEKDSDHAQLSRFYSKILEQAAQLPLYTMAHSGLTWKAWAWIRKQPEKPQVYWQLFTRRVFLQHQSVDWDEVVEAGEHCEEANLLWQLQVWLHWGLVRPQASQVEPLLRRIHQQALASHQDDALSAALRDGYLTEHSAHELQTWVELLGPNWPLTCTEILATL